MLGWPSSGQLLAWVGAGCALAAVVAISWWVRVVVAVSGGGAPSFGCVGDAGAWRFPLGGGLGWWWRFPSVASGGWGLSGGCVWVWAIRVAAWGGWGPGCGFGLGFGCLWWGLG